MQEKHDHVMVTVSASGEEIVCIETNCLSGREITPADEAAIKWASVMLASFVGLPGIADPAATMNEVVEVLEPLAAYGRVLRGQRTRGDKPLVELWEHQITGNDLIAVADLLSKLGRG